MAVALVVLAAAAVILLERGAEFGPAATGSAPSSSSLGRSVEAVARAHGVPQPVAECAAERVVLDGELGAAANAVEVERHAHAAANECSAAYDLPSGTGLPPAHSTAGPMSIQWQEFAQRVDQICAVDYNKAIATEAAIEATADRRHWSNARTEAVLHYAWAEEQAETHRLVAALGRPPARARLLARWNANVGRRGELFHDLGDAWKYGEAARSERIWSRIMELKDEANRIGQRFGLRVYTSN